MASRLFGKHFDIESRHFQHDVLLPNQGKYDFTLASLGSMEFQAIVMAAGPGSRMTDLTARCPKALLPIGNFPLVWYPVNMLERAGFEEAIIIVLESFASEAQKALCEVCDVKIKLDFVSIPDNDYMGTGDSLRFIKDKIKGDVMIVSCDLISDISLHQIANVHRAYDSSLTMLLSPLPEKCTEIPPPGVKTKRKNERDFIGLDENDKRVLFYTAEADLEETVNFRKTHLKKHPFVSIHSKLTDCHLYLLKKWVVDFLSENKRISAVKSELLPYIIKQQFTKPKTIDTDTQNTNTSLVSMDTKTHVHGYKQGDKMTELIQELSTWIDHDGDMADCYHGEQIRCYAHIQKEGFCVRVNTLAAYCEANRQIPRLLSVLAPAKEISNVHSSVTLKGKSQVGSDCLVSEGVILGERSSIKRSVIGRHCTIGDKVKITNCVLMDHVVVQEGSNLQGSIVCGRAEISEKCELKDCIVGHSQNIVAMGKFTNEAIIDVERMMEI